MSNLIVLNHHSLPFVSKADADAGVLIFLNTIKECHKAGLNLLLVDEGQDQSLMGLELFNGYFMRDWIALNQNTQLRDWCRFLKTIATKYPNLILDGITNIEVGFKGDDSGRGVLLAAYYYGLFLVSFASSAKWKMPYLDIWVFNLNTTPNESQSKLLNLSDEVSVDDHKVILTQQRNDKLNTASDIWKNRDALFPNLVLIDEQFGHALQTWSGRSDILNKARDALNILEKFCLGWKEGVYETYRHSYLLSLGLEVSSESSLINQDTKKKEARMFWLPDARKVYCENHIKLQAGFRMHFYVDILQKRIYVAYLGPHLPL